MPNKSNSEVVKILILTPNLSNPGGVSALYNILKLDKFENIEYFNVQGKKGQGLIFRLFGLWISYLEFFFKCFSFDIVQINPSFDRKSFYRDGLYILISRIVGKKVLVYWHGWNTVFQDTVQSGTFSYLFLKLTYKRAHSHIVLGSIFKDRLINLKIDSKDIIIESNAADDSFLKENQITEKEKNGQIELLFIARIEEQKGIMIVLDTMKILNEKGNYHLKIAGDGPLLNAAKNKVLKEQINNVDFLGQINGVDKHNAFSGADILFFPTYYPEGMPISIIEGILYGLVIVSRPVGGIPDWVKVPSNGVLTDSLDPLDYVALIESLCVDKEKMHQVEVTNKEYAQSYFTPSALTKRMLTNYSNIISE
jgi:glycosyltransferase involved in cell wall biosynthesis